MGAGAGWRAGVRRGVESRSSQKLAPSRQHSSDAPSRTSTPTATSQLRALRMTRGSPNATERARRRSEVFKGDPKGICLARGEGQRGLLGKPTQRRHSVGFVRPCQEARAPTANAQNGHGPTSAIAIPKRPGNTPAPALAAGRFVRRAARSASAPRAQPGCTHALAHVAQGCIDSASHARSACLPSGTGARLGTDVRVAQQAGQSAGAYPAN